MGTASFFDIFAVKLNVVWAGGALAKTQSGDRRLDLTC
jgi:hypothetical protein